MLGRNGWNLEANPWEKVSQFSRVEDSCSRFPKTCWCIHENVIALHHLHTDFQLSVAEIIETPI